MFVGPLLTRPVCHLLGYLYPAFQSYRAVRLNDPALHTQWLTFWIVNTYFSVLESLGDTVLSWLPFYYEAKVALLVWLVAPQFRGATKLYEKLIDPYLNHYEKDIDAGVAQVKRRSAKQIGQIGRYGLQHIRTQSTELLKLGQQVLLQQQASSAEEERALEAVLAEDRRRAAAESKHKTMAEGLEAKEAYA